MQSPDLPKSLAGSQNLRSAAILPAVQSAYTVVQKMMAETFAILHLAFWPSGVLLEAGATAR